MKMEVIEGSRGNLVLKIQFEDTGKPTSNFRKDNLTWIPTIEEMKQLTRAFEMHIKFYEWEKQKEEKK